MVACSLRRICSLIVSVRYLLLVRLQFLMGIVPLALLASSLQAALAERIYGEAPTPVESLGRLLRTWNLLKLSLPSSRNLCSLFLMDSAFAQQLRQ